MADYSSQDGAEIARAVLLFPHHRESYFKTATGSKSDFEAKVRGLASTRLEDPYAVAHSAVPALWTVDDVFLGIKDGGPLFDALAQVIPSQPTIGILGAGPTGLRLAAKLLEMIVAAAVEQMEMQATDSKQKSRDCLPNKALRLRVLASTRIVLVESRPFWRGNMVYCVPDVCEATKRTPEYQQYSKFWHYWPIKDLQKILLQDIGNRFDELTIALSAHKTDLKLRLQHFFHLRGDGHRYEPRYDSGQSSLWDEANVMIESMQDERKSEGKNLSNDDSAYGYQYYYRDAGYHARVVERVQSAFVVDSSSTIISRTRIPERLIAVVAACGPSANRWRSNPAVTPGNDNLEEGCNAWLEDPTSFGGSSSDKYFGGDLRGHGIVLNIRNQPLAAGIHEHDGDDDHPECPNLDEIKMHTRPEKEGEWGSEKDCYGSVYFIPCHVFEKEEYSCEDDEVHANGLSHGNKVGTFTFQIDAWRDGALFPPSLFGEEALENFYAWMAHNKIGQPSCGRTPCTLEVVSNIKSEGNDVNEQMLARMQNACWELISDCWQEEEEEIDGAWVPRKLAEGENRRPFMDGLKRESVEFYLIRQQEYQWKSRVLDGRNLEELRKMALTLKHQKHRS